MSTARVQRHVALRIKFLEIKCACSFDPFARQLSHLLENIKPERTLSNDMIPYVRERYKKIYFDFENALHEIGEITIVAESSQHVHISVAAQLRHVADRMIYAREQWEFIAAAQAKFELNRIRYARSFLNTAQSTD